MLFLVANLTLFMPTYLDVDRKVNGNCIITVLMSSMFLFFIFTKKDWKTEFTERKLSFSIKLGILVSLIIISITILLTYTSITMLVFGILFSSR